MAQRSSAVGKGILRFGLPAEQPLQSF